MINNFFKVDKNVGQRRDTAKELFWCIGYVNNYSFIKFKTGSDFVELQ